MYFWHRENIFLFSDVFRLAVGSTQLPIQWVVGLFCGGKGARA
jgi:hypothetical protein